LNLVHLFHLCDSLFPVGAFAHSDGLETATVEGRVATPADLQRWLDVCLDETIGRTEGPIVSAARDAWGDRRWQALQALDVEAIVLRPSAAARSASRAMGQRLLTTWHGLHPDPRHGHVIRLMEGGAAGPALPVAFGCVCAGLEVPARTAVEAFSYTRLAAVVSAAMRLMPVGQGEAHRILARTLDRVPAVAAAITPASGGRAAPPTSFAPAVDIAQMRQQYLHSRLFRS
jgi:urease accessory protein